MTFNMYKLFVGGSCILLLIYYFFTSMIWLSYISFGVFSSNTSVLGSYLLIVVNIIIFVFVIPSCIIYSFFKFSKRIENKQRK